MTPEDPDFIRASDWLAREHEDADVVILGAPYGGASLSGARCDLTPAAVRAELARFSVWSSDHGVSLERLRPRDAGDIEPGDGVEATQDAIQDAVARARGDDTPVILIGGDNSITVGGARGVEADALLTFDAHHDCRDPSVRVSNGSPVRQLMESGLQRVAQVGIHGFANAEAHARWAIDHKVHVVRARRVWDEGPEKAVTGAVRLLGHARRIWVDFDIDVLDRAFAPGSSASLPAGLAPYHLEEAAFILGANRAVAGMDITEVDPSTDVAQTTVRAACGIMLSFLAGVASR